jgi:hypothetical protein
METREIQAWPQHQGSQPGDKVQWLQHHVGRPVPERLFVLIHNPAPAIDGQPLGGNGRCSDSFQTNLSNLRLSDEKSAITRLDQEIWRSLETLSAQ